MDTEALGFIAGFLTTFSFAFQVIKILKTPDKKQATENISLLMYFTFVMGVFLWLIYGILIDSLPIIGWNALTLFLSFIVLFITYRFHGPIWFQKCFE
jgi:MtN3 and saliva related transmembrane protein